MITVILMYACRDGEELDSQGDASSQPDTISIASRTSQNTLDSDKVGTPPLKKTPTHYLKAFLIFKMYNPDSKKVVTLCKSYMKQNGMIADHCCYFTS